MDEKKLNLYYFQVIDIWQRLCMEHSSLLEATYDEYELLLKSDIDALEEKISEKEGIISKINQLELLRQEVINTLNNNLEQKITNVGELVLLMERFEKEKERRHLFDFNELLIDIIDKIQDQNKKNQLFINKAIISLRSLRRSANGRPHVELYKADGNTTFQTKI